MSFGDWISGSGNTMDQIAAAARGQQSPTGAQGQPPAANPPPPSGQPNQPPSQATASPPDLTQLYVKLAQQDRAANMFDRGLAGMQAAFAPPGQQAAWLNSAPPQQDAGAMVENLMKIQQMQFQRQNQQTIMNSAPALAEQLFGPKPTPQQIQTAQGIIASGKYGDVETNLVGSGDLDQRQYLQEQRANQQAGQPTVDFSTWKAQHATAAAVGTEAAKTKFDAADTFPSLDPQYKTAEDTVDWLNQHPDATVRAVQWGSAANGRVGQSLGGLGILDQDTKDARSKIDQLNDENFRAGLANVKNVRSQSEANKVGGAVSSLDKPGNSPQMITQELGRLTNTIQSARGNLMGAAGRVIPYKYNNMIDPSYLDPNSQTYNGAKMEVPVDLSKMNDADADAAFEKLPSGRAFIGPDGQPHTKK
jgi:hypothetical protein